MIRVPPALLVKRTLISGCLLLWTDVLTQVHGARTKKALTSSKPNPLETAHKEIQVKTKQLTLRNQEER